MKKFRSSAAPKGTKLGSGYQDRTQLRTSGEENDKAIRIKALEDLVKLGQMEYATFQKLRDEIVGGDVKNVHLVKGLDFKLLERVRKGEDVLASTASPADLSNEAAEQGSQSAASVDDELARLEDRKQEPLIKESKPKQGEMAPSGPITGQKRTRDDILKELRASRLKAAEESKAQQPSLGPRFSKVGQNREASRIEKDKMGREVLISTDKDGNVKRKIRKERIEDSSREQQSLLMPDKNAAPLGIDVVPLVPRIASHESEDHDIFEGIGTDYNPLGDGEDDDTDSEDREARQEPDGARYPLPPQTHDPVGHVSAMPPPPSPHTAVSKKKNYFGESEETNESTVSNPLTDPNILAALKKASSINPISTQTLGNEEEIARHERHRKMINSHDRDAEDMDMAFGNSRFGDEEDGEEKKVRLSIWGQDGDDKQNEDGSEKSKRKRGSKKKKGDSAADVLRVMENRKRK